MSITWRLIGRSTELEITKSATTTLEQEHFLPIISYITNVLASLSIVNHRTTRYVNIDVLTVSAMTFITSTITTMLSKEVTLIFEVQAADIAIVNQEVIIGGEELGVSGYPSFNAPYEVADALADTGFDVILHGTNHAMDQGKKGITNCLSNWEKKYPDIKILGINKSQDAQDTITVLEKNGIKIAVLNYTYGLNGIALPSDMPYAVNLLDEEKVKADIASAKEQSDFVIVCPHWGTEYSLQPDSMQKKWTKIFAESGADLVLGTHPHVIEPIEWVEDETTGHQMLVYYSLGNFVNWTSSSGDGIANRMVGGMAEITVGFDEAGKGFIVDYGVNALVTQVEQGHGGVTTYFLRDYTDEMAGKNAIIEQDANFSREYCTKLCTDIWGDLWE